MFQTFSSTPNTKSLSKNPPLINPLPDHSCPNSEHCKNNYTRYSETSQTPESTQNSFFTPSGNGLKKPQVLDDITNIMLNVHPKRLEFSASMDTSTSVNQTPNYILKKLSNENFQKPEHRDQENLFQMEIEDNDNSAIELEKNDIDEGISNNTLIEELMPSSENRKRSFQKINTDFVRPKPKNYTLIKRWKKSDKIFHGKYSTGATPKVSRGNVKDSVPLSLIPFKRSNTDVPPTFESEQLMMIGEKSEIGTNKYIENLANTTNAVKPTGLTFPTPNMLLKQALSKQQLNLSLKAKSDQINKISQTNSQGTKPKLLRDFPLGLTQHNSLQSLAVQKDTGLFLIPEKSRETDRLLIFPKDNQQMNTEDNKNKGDLVSKLLNFDDEEDDDKSSNNFDFLQGKSRNSQKMQEEPLIGPFDRGDFQNQDCMSPERKDFQTPTKRNSPLSEVKFNFFNTVTAKKDAQSKLSSNSSNPEEGKRAARINGKEEFENSKIEAEDSGFHSHSRFEQDYEVLEVLGSGYFGTVYKCQNKLDGLIYAIKCTRNKLKGKNNINQALNEAQALASLSVLDENPFIVRYYSAWIEDDRLYLAMEHCQSNLKTLRHQHIKFSESMIRQIMRDICMGLRHLHNQKIVHLDIKPENILYSKTKKYKIADLGLSRIAQRSNNEDINEGDCRYLAPELLRDYPDAQLPDLTKADIFSFGATIYELMIGTDLPRNGKEWTNLREGYLYKLDQLNYSNSLKSMLRSMMSNNPDHRPSANELLTNFLQSEIELELKWEKKQNKILKEKVKELEGKLKSKRKNSM